MSRTHSIMRVASTASPVSGSEVRERMLALTEWYVKIYFFGGGVDGMVLRYLFFGSGVVRDRQQVITISSIFGGDAFLGGDEGFHIFIKHCRHSFSHLLQV